MSCGASPNQSWSFAARISQRLKCAGSRTPICCDERALAEADEDAPPRPDAPLVLLVERRERGVDDALGGVGVVVPCAPAGVRRCRPLRANDPAEDARHPSPLAAILEGVPTPPVEVQNDR